MFLSFCRRAFGLVWLLCLVSVGLWGQEKIRLQILDAESRLSIPAAYVKLGTLQQVADADGWVSLPKSAWGAKSRLLVRAVGYKSSTPLCGEVKCIHMGHFCCLLTPDEVSLGAVVVEGERRPTSINTVSAHVKPERIAQAVGGSLANLLEDVSGVSSIRTGTTIALPVIHGMYGSRILIINNGVRQSGQSWGEDHAPEIDLSSNDNIFVVKGADAVKYGSQALGGTIILEQKDLPYGGRRFSAGNSMLAASNGWRYSNALRVTGAFSLLGDVAWRAQGTYSEGGDRSTARYLLNNTGMQESNLSATLGWRRGAWRLEASYSLYNNKAGIMRSAQMGSVELLAERIELGQPVEFTPFTRSIAYPYHDVEHHLLSLKGYWSSPRWGNYQLQLSQQFNDRREYAIRRNNNSEIPSLALNLSTSQVQLRWDKSWGHGWRSEAGALYSLANNYSTPGTGVVPIIPNYVDLSYGAYVMQRYARDGWGVELGGRYDWQWSHAQGMNDQGLRYGGMRDFASLSYNLGGHVMLIDGLKLTSNFGLAWRAPQVHELYSYGHKHGSGTYVIGDANLKSERSYKWITSLGYSSQRWRINLDAYLQWVDGYIYDEPSRGEQKILISGAYPVFRYKQSDAFFRGVDFDLGYHLTHSLGYQAQTSMIWANERLTGRYLPFIPAWRVSQSLTWSPKIDFLPNASFSLKHRFVDKQRRFDPETDLIAYTPEAYHLFGVELGVKSQLSERSSLRVVLEGENILNAFYKEYTNRARYYAHDAGRDIRLSIHYEF